MGSMGDVIFPQTETMLMTSNCFLTINIGLIALDLGKETKIVGLKINTNKTKVVCLTSHRNLLSSINELNIADVD